MSRDLRSRGIPEGQIAEYVAARLKVIGKEKELGVYEENWNSVEVYRRCNWQVQLGGMGGACYTGIAAIEIETVARILGIAVDIELLDCVRCIEGAAAKVLNAKGSK